MNDNEMECPSDSEEDYDCYLSESEIDWVEGRPDLAEFYTRPLEIWTHVAVLKPAVCLLFILVACYNADNHNHDYAWDLPARKFKPHYLHLVYLMAMSIAFLSFCSGYYTRVPIPCRAEHSAEDYRKELLRCIRTTFGWYHWTWNWLCGLTLEKSAFDERFRLAMVIANPRIRPPPFGMHSKEYCSWYMGAASLSLISYIQCIYDVICPPSQLGWKDCIGLAFIFSVCYLLLSFFPVAGWYWKQATFVQLIRQECLKSSFPGNYDLEKGKGYRLTAKERIEWWMWDILRAETGSEEEELREVRMFQILNSVPIQI
ncbi:hypothetical protein HYFRA_00011511 [Hymenoscyphus fraxineus]|uniref:Uncharacterized protein n=1 Tax=Hymenoscyphus fraxineus TaxID=746836 RepID=A0A9N9PWU7_9HELO|nr:hypothetical protein HYFRA_00011511 [Hymenoscyphus fraxineus]